LPEYEYILKEKSQFWLVKPTLSLSGATDTNALLGGAYITFNVGDGDAKSSFDLLTSPPAKHASAKGLQLTLISEHASVATPGSAISYRGVTVGQVDNVALNKLTDKIHVSITIDEDHQQLIQQNSRFYNASGLTISGGLSNLVVKTESIDAILRGGISFYNPRPVQQKLKNVKELAKFNLFKHIESAKNSGLSINIHFDDPSGLKVNSKVIYQEQEVGVIERLLFNDTKTGATALVLLNDLGVKYAKAGSQFWKVEPEIGLVGSKNVSALLDGAFITLLPSNQYATDIHPAEVHTTFTALDLAPTVTALPYGLNVQLVTNRLGSVRVGNPILYRQVKVGSVIGIGLSDNADSVNVYINIAKRYAPLVKSSSKFWNTSGIKIKAGLLSGIDIDSESIETLISGGIAFSTPPTDQSDDTIKPSLTAGDNSWPYSFSIYQSVDSDWLTWQAKIPLNQ